MCRNYAYYTKLLTTTLLRYSCYEWPTLPNVDESVNSIKLVKNLCIYIGNNRLFCRPITVVRSFSKSIKKAVNRCLGISITKKM